METTRTTLLVRLRNRSDQQAWETFDRLYRPMLVGYARKRGLDDASADDVAQECVESVLRHIADYQHVGSFRAWLRTIVENKIKDAFRRRRDRQGDTDLWEQQMDSGASPEEIWEKHWLLEHVRYCVEQVRPEVEEHTYQAFYQTVIEQRTPKETAERLGSTLNQVYVAKFRMLERIRAMLIDLSGVDLAEDLR